MEIKCTQKEKALLSEIINNYSAELLHELCGCGIAPCSDITSCYECIDEDIKWIIKDNKGSNLYDRN